MTAFTIKMIALASMIIDHIGAVYDIDNFRLVGRLAFPIFVFLIAEGCKHTKSMDKYMLRLGLFALISEVPFDLAFNSYVDFFNDANIFYTLWLGVASIYMHRLLRNFLRNFSNILSVIPLCIAMIAAEWVGSDYGAVGVVFIFVMSVFGEFKPLQLMVISLFMFILYFPFMDMLIASLIAVPIVAFASGRRGLPVKWLFYLAYPAHLLVLAALVNSSIITS